MLRIRAAQVQVFEDQVFMPRYEATLLACVREFHAAAADIDDTALIDQVRRCTARARRHGAPDAVAWASGWISRWGRARPPPALVALARADAVPYRPLAGIHEMHDAMVATLAMGLGLFAPPLGVGDYAACAIARVDPDRGLRPMGRCLLALFAGVAVVAAVLGCRPGSSEDARRRSRRRADEGHPLEPGRRRAEPVLYSKSPRCRVPPCW